MMCVYGTQSCDTMHECIMEEQGLCTCVACVLAFIAASLIS